MNFSNLQDHHDVAGWNFDCYKNAVCRQIITCVYNSYVILRCSHYLEQQSSAASKNYKEYKI